MIEGYGIMSRLEIEAFTEENITKWGLFYSEAGGDRKLLNLDFKPVVYGTEEEARFKLEALEAERSSEDAAIPFSVDEAKKFVSGHNWKFASTYAKTAPHEYLVKRWLSEADKLLFERLVQTINTEFVIGYFYGNENKYLILGDYYYWYMPVYPDNMAVDLINRTTIDYLEYREGAYYYKGKEQIHPKMGAML